MTDNGAGGHTDLDRLAAHAEGGLSAPDAAEVERHLAGCLACRVEAARLRRFSEIDRDEATSAEADWPRARVVLDEGFRRSVLPAIRRGRPSESKVSPLGQLTEFGRRRLWWPVPAAAAAALLIAVLGIERFAGDWGGFGGGDPVRGGEGRANEIAALAPAGDLAALPEAFTWTAAGEFESFTLEIYSPELNLVFRRAGLTGRSFSVSDSLRGLLAAGGRFIWNVQGIRGPTAVASSPHAWFSLPDGAARD